MKYKFITICVLSIIIANAGAQDQHGSSQYRARNIHAGNLIRVSFYNHGMLGGIKGDQSLIYAGEWPINTGMVQMGNASSYVLSELRTYAGRDSLGDSTYTYITPCVFCQGWDPNVFSHDSLGVFLGFEPLPGYYNIANKEKDPYHAVAMSHEAYTWPASWPDKMGDAINPGWSGHWNGYFGKDQKNADEESFYAMDDYSFKKKVAGLHLPKPIPSQPLRGGIGLRQFIRGLQWSNPDAQDCIFWIYNIKNIGELNHAKTVFGLNVGASIGAKLGENTDYDDDCATFYREIDLTVNYDWDNIGTGGYRPVPWVGFAFLESPGNAKDGIDNDGDGSAGGGHLITNEDFLKFYKIGEPVVLIDYASANYTRTVSTMPAEGVTIHFNGDTYLKKPNAPLQEIPRNGIDDNLNGFIDESDGAVAPDSMAYYLYIRDAKYNNRDYLAKDYLTGEGLNNLLIDERRNDGIDNDNDWDIKTDDLGMDGKSGSGDVGEGDGLPTAAVGDLPGEPNVDRTDVDESDQIGLTSFIFYEYSNVTYSNDAQMWDVSRPGFFDGHLENVDADYIFSCGYFPLAPEQEESFSVAMIYGWDQEDILRNKDIVQKIYNSNYNFAVAPEKPLVRAVVGNQKVTLYWDARAEESVDRYLHEYDFEGYKIYRATDPGFSDAGAITDGYGYARFVKPIAIYDKVDSVFGFFPKTFGTGVQYNLGNETGLVHTFVDSPLVNGKRYFYAVNAYDRGNLEKNIAPSETNMFVSVDASGEIRTGENVAAVIPQAPAIGYVGPGLDEQPHQIGTGKTSGKVSVRYIEPEKIRDGDRYEVQFLDKSMDRHDNDNDGLIDKADKDELMPTLTTGLVLRNKSNTSVPEDTVMFVRREYQNGKWIEVQNLYADNDGDPRTLKTMLNGMELTIYNPPEGLINRPEERIYSGVQWSRNINFSNAYNIRFGLFNLSGFKTGTYYPRQYSVVFYDDIVKKSDVLQVELATSTKKIPLPAANANFRIFDKQTGQELPFAYVDQTLTPKKIKAGCFSAKDRIVMFEKLANDSTMITFNILNNATEDTTFWNAYGRGLSAGDTLNVYPDFPFTGNVRYQFVVRGQKIDQVSASKNLDKIRVVPNPYVVTASWEVSNPYTSGRGPRSVQFIHLPQKCTIRIFAVDGTLVNTIEHDAAMTDGSEEWDLLTKDRMDISYGIYLYHIEAQGIGKTTGRILIIK
jgi:hypothetical protein